jgi:hypothetical protein
MMEPSTDFDYDLIDGERKTTTVTDENVLALGIVFLWLMDGGPKTTKPDLARWGALWWLINDNEDSHLSQSKIAIDLKISKKKLCEAISDLTATFPFKSRNIRPDDVRKKYSELKARYHERRKKRSATGNGAPGDCAPEQC